MRNEKTNGPSISAVVFGKSHGSIASPEALGSHFTEGEQGCPLGVRMAQSLRWLLEPSLSEKSGVMMVSLVEDANEGS